MKMLTANSQHLPYKLISQEISSRSSIFAVCFCFLFAMAPHFRNLPLWVSGFVLLALGWRCLQNLDKVRQLPKWLLIPMVLIGGIGVFAEYWTIVGRDAGLALLTVMTSFKFLEGRSHRDMLILIFLCYFMIATHFLYSQSIFTAVLMLITLIVITATLITLNQRDDSVSVKRRIGLSVRMILQAMPLMLILFILVPRIPGPLWGLTSEQRGGITGLSNSISPGKISNLIRSNEVAFRVDFRDAVPPQNKLYWRGPVMAMFNGYSWYQSRRNNLISFDLNSFEAATRYTITLEPNGERWLLALDIPTQLVADSIMTEDFQLTSKTRINDLRRYSLQSRLVYQVGRQEKLEYLDLTLNYPEDSNPRTIALGKSLAETYDTPEQIIGAVLQMYRDQEFVYTLKPPPLRGDVIDAFLFDSRRGFCEHYAGSFALLMRAAGIPSRIVAGYQGGEYNLVGNYLIVRQSDAHAWTEVWIKNRGWIRIDPTAAVSPMRIELGLDQALPEETARFRIRNRNPIFGNLLYSWDSLQHSWNDWVLNYDQRKQMNFLRDLEIGIENWSDMVFALVALLMSVTGFFWLSGWYRDLPPKPAIYEIHFNRLMKKLAKIGLHRKPAEDTRKFLRRVSLSNIAEAEQLAKIIDLYNLIKYSRAGVTQSSIHKLRGMVKAIRL